MVIKPLRKILRSQMLLNKISKVEWLHNLNARAVGKYILLWKAKTNPQREIILMYAPTCLSYTFKILLPYFVFLSTTENWSKNYSRTAFKFQTHHIW